MVYYAIEPPKPWTNIEGKPYITVSAKGIANGLSDIFNDGADFGPDTPGTQTSGIQEAILYQQKTGSRIKVLPGTYYISNGIGLKNPSSTLGLPTIQNDVYIEFEPEVKITTQNGIPPFSYSGGAPKLFFIFNNVETNYNIILKGNNTILDGNSQNLPSNYTACTIMALNVYTDVSSTNTGQIKVSGFNFINLGNINNPVLYPSCIHFGNSSNLEVFNNIFNEYATSTTFSGAIDTLTNLGNSIDISNINIHDNKFLSGGDDLISILSAHNVQIHHNYFNTSVFASGKSGRFIDLVQNDYDINIYENIFEYPTDTSIETYAGSSGIGTHNLNITNNIFRNASSGMHPIHISYNSYNVNINNNIFDTYGQMGIFSQGKYVNIKNNIFINLTTGNGIPNNGGLTGVIYLFNGASNHNIKGNIAIDTQSTHTQLVGLSTEINNYFPSSAYLTNIVIKNNYFNGYGSYTPSPYRSSNGSYFMNWDNSGPPFGLTNVQITGDPNFQPSATTPSVPASGTAVTNSYPYPVKVYINGGALTQIQITVNGTTYTVYSNSTASAVYENFTLPVGASITLTYSTAPTWTWVPELL